MLTTNPAIPSLRGGSIPPLLARCARSLLAVLACLFLNLVGMAPVPSTHAASAPTVRLWATREGLVGRPTASGHVIEPNDHFVALPSRTALGHTVHMSHAGKSVDAPVLDVGPWNINDPFWEANRSGPFSDLPRWIPESWAAWSQGYNGGRDGTGRTVTFPAMIDLSDGVYADLGLGEADWVDVTFTWLDAPSPSPMASPDTPILKKADTSEPHDERYYAETRFRVDNDDIWSYFQARGRVDTFGYPVSRTFTMLGCQTQIFQRQVAQVCPGQGVSLMNLLDPDVFPYSRVNGSTFPAPDNALKEQTPAVSSPGYGNKILDFVRTNTPDLFEGQQVDFAKAFFAAAAHSSSGNPLVNLEVWGAPISKPQRDPGNGQFVYQRFQRGIMHFDATTGRTQGLLLADYLKALMMKTNLPADLQGQVAGNKFFNQYCPSLAHSICRSNDLPATDLTQAFEPG